VGGIVDGGDEAREKGRSYGAIHPRPAEHGRGAHGNHAGLDVAHRDRADVDLRNDSRLHLRRRSPGENAGVRRLHLQAEGLRDVGLEHQLGGAGVEHQGQAPSADGQLDEGQRFVDEEG
jgi:hypothetical protein